MIGGEVLMEDGQLKRVKKDRILDELRADAEHASQLPYREARRLMQAIRPYVRQYYDTWFRQRGEPHYYYNSRG